MDKTDIKIKQMKPSDSSEVLSLWEKAGLAINQQDLFEMQSTMKMNPKSCLTLTKDDAIIGAVLGTFNGKRGWIYHLAIHPNFHSFGYGSLLLKKAEKELKKKGAKRVFLGVSFKNLKVLPFYEKSGYSVVNDALWLGKNT